MHLHRARLSADARTLSFLDTGGDGSPVVLLHAFPLSARMWEHQLAALTGRHRAVAPDLAGFGASEVPSERSAYSMTAYADDVAGLVAELELGPVALVGLSLGGYVAFEVLRRHRDVVRALVLADTRAGPDTDEVRQRRSEQQRRVAAGGRQAVVEELAGGLVRPGGDPALRTEVIALMDQPPAGIIGALEAMKARPDSTPDLAGIDVPTLVMVGEEDPTSPVATARAMHQAIPGSELVVVPGAAHLSNLEAPAAFNLALLGFLRRT